MRFRSGAADTAARTSALRRSMWAASLSCHSRIPAPRLLKQEERLPGPDQIGPVKWNNSSKQEVHPAEAGDAREPHHPYQLRDREERRSSEKKSPPSQSRFFSKIFCHRDPNQQADSSVQIQSGQPDFLETVYPEEQVLGDGVGGRARGPWRSAVGSDERRFAGRDLLSRST